MQSYYQYLHRSLRCCLNCGSLFPDDSLFCQTCFSQLETFSKQETRIISDGNNRFKTQSLYAWNPDLNRPLSGLVAILKGGQLQSTFDFYAKRFAQKKECAHQVLLVPCPSKLGENDHAMAWARALSKQIPEAEIWNVLKTPSDQPSQKLRNKMERRKLRFEKNENITHEKCLKVVFVDDVVTTGASALAAYEALGRPENFEAWTIADRELRTAGLYI